jgi:hypothetical protein
MSSIDCENNGLGEPFARTLPERHPDTRGDIFRLLRLETASREAISPSPAWGLRPTAYLTAYPWQSVTRQDAL